MQVESSFIVEFQPNGRTAQCPTNPEFPDGKDVNVSAPGKPSCTVALPYPAQSCGLHIILCKACGRSAALTAAGRRDDPKTLTLPCKTDRTPSA